jgi:hypothetical protein
MQGNEALSSELEALTEEGNKVQRRLAVVQREQQLKLALLETLAAGITSTAGDVDKVWCVVLVGVSGDGMHAPLHQCRDAGRMVWMTRILQQA